MPPLLRMLFQYDWDSRSAKTLDWGLALLSLLIGVYLQSAVWIAGGVLGVILAWWRPMVRMQRFLTSARVRR